MLTVNHRKGINLPRMTGTHAYTVLLPLADARCIPIPRTRFTRCLVLIETPCSRPTMPTMPYLGTDTGDNVVSPRIRERLQPPPWTWGARCGSDLYGIIECMTRLPSFCFVDLWWEVELADKDEGNRVLPCKPNQLKGRRSRRFHLGRAL